MLLHAVMRLRPILAGAVLLSLLGFAPAVAQASGNTWGKPYNQMPQAPMHTPKNYDNNGYGNQNYGYGQGYNNYDNNGYGNQNYGYGQGYNNYGNNGYGNQNYGYGQGYNNYGNNGYGNQNYGYGQGYNNYGNNGYGNQNYGHNYTNQPGALLYRVTPGDTLAKIAARFGTSIGAILQANPSIRNPNVIYSGQTLAIPAGFAGAYAAPAPYNPPPAYHAPQPMYRPPAGRGY